MGYGSDSGSQDGRDEDDEDDYEEAGGSNRLLGFMFGNVDNSGDLDVDYLDEDAKEHLSALADKLGSSLTDIDLSVKSSRTAADNADQDYDEKAEDAVDYEDFDEQYEGPEVQAATEEDYLLSKKAYISNSLAILKPTPSVFDDENYDEEIEEEQEVVDNDTKVQNTTLLGEEVKSPEVDSIKEKSSEDDHETDSHDTETLASDIEESQEELSEKDPTPLPVLCIEDGKVILQFSEIFGIHEPVKKRDKRDHKYFVPKDRFKSIDVSNIVEEDEEEFLRGSGQSFMSLKQEEFYKDDHDDIESESQNSGSLQGVALAGSQYDGSRKDSFLSAEPMKEETVICPAGRHSPSSATFYPLDQLDWEVGIVWDNSPVVSENSVGSTELHFEATVTDSETESEARLQNHKVNTVVVADEKTHKNLVHSSPIILEQFGTRTSGSSSLPFSEGRYHPQLLRLESRSEVNDSNQDYEGMEKVVEKQPHRTGAAKQFSKLISLNKDMLEGSWLDSIIWEQGRPIRKPKLILDLQDEQMLFEILDSKDGKDLRLHAGAMIVTRSVKSGHGDSLELPGHGGQSVWRLVANDKHYSNKKTSQQMKSNSKKRTAQGVKLYHSQPAVTLQTMKLKLSNKDIANFHRPKALWYPHDNEVALKEQGKLPTQGPMKLIVKSLGGKGSKLHVDAEETISSVKAKASKKLDFKSTETVKLFYRGKELEDDKSLVTQNVPPNSLLHLVRTKIHLLPRAQKLPGENKSLRPPGAFKKKSDLSVKDGHVFLMEYCEERPLLLSNIGMGARLCTYYQKSAPDDQTAISMRSANNNFGHVVSLNPADKSPFLGDIKSGCNQSSLETNMYRAPLFSHKVPATDYLLVRSAKGKLSLRRIDRVNAVGQQEPLMEVMSPGTKNLQNYMINRLLVHMCREFRAAEKRHMTPCIRADGLQSQFPYLSEVFIKKKLKEYANMHVQRGSIAQSIWVKKNNFRIFSEDELRNMVKPEEVCAYESMQAGLYRLKHLGITETHPNAISSAMSRLPDEAIALAAASHIERELQITPWNLSSNFVASTQGKENIERMEITGVGDPSGRGLGFSYVRAAQKTPVPSAVVKKKSAAGRGGTTVTGTDADLRRLSMEAAREVLLKFDVPDEVIAKQTRWHRIAMIRKLSSEQAALGVKVDPTTISKYARGQRMSFLQLQQQTREKCQEIWDRQVQSLSAFDGDENESDSEENNSDLDSFAGDLENLLDAEECEEGVEESKNDKADGVKGLKMRGRPSLAQAEEEIEDEAAEAAELCRLLMDDDEAAGKKKKKVRLMGEEAGLTPAPRINYGVENADRVKLSTSTNPHDGPYSSKENTIAEAKVVENLLLKRNKIGKLKQKKKNDDTVNINLTNKKIKIAGDTTVKMFKEKKNARESFVCGACGQLGHMRTNKNCPKYREVDTNVDTPEPEKAVGKSATLTQSAPSQTKATTKKLIPKSATKIALVEASEGENITPGTKVPVKFKCSSADKVPDRFSVGVTQSIDQPMTSDTETGRSAVKVNKIIISNKAKPEDVQVESHKPPIVIRPPTDMDRGQVEPQKPTIVIRPPANIERDRFASHKISKRPRTEKDREHSHKKIIIRRPKEIIDVDQIAQDGGSSIDHRKTKRIVELSSFEMHRNQENVYLAEAAKKKARDKRKRWEEQERRRNEEMLREERARRIREEEMKMLEEQERVAEIRRYEVSIRREREEEERQKAKKKKKRKMPEIEDDYIEDSRARRFDKRLPDRERSTKRRSVAELGRYGAESAATTKRRRGGEVGLANILEQIVETLKDRIEVSYLFLKPVSKKEAPDYLDIIERPMDLSTIKEKVRKLEYKSREQFRHDVWQIAFNAHQYNDGRNPGIPPLADQLLELCDYILNENDESLTDAEAGIESRDFM
ncbi:transcription initiation factor TFIID subunit 1 isoform X2 [Cannabis sativa]|uniref:transcription initiation factor TFIID subunit 1 isoform X2 n=1 Tax=Cannabis sativa TaxID=3483 RepID=UPI0029CA6192|nr:transcription initiation factor TFIID subunit 1 isoform X2 [Cannabis sativa]XP_060973451.1 transcription initiation factor TFIID subunit 1 isoform X2 [Cannabis sativa]XP_060973452.1 transcription initiation factor TFIID subunit 1 isoform X2 [Cannabis sativa]